MSLSLLLSLLLSKVKVKSTPSLRPKTWSLTKVRVWHSSDHSYIIPFILYVAFVELILLNDLTPPLKFVFISGMIHSSGLGGLLDAVPVKKMLHIPKKVVGGFFRKLKISFLIN